MTFLIHRNLSVIFFPIARNTCSKHDFLWKIKTFLPPPKKLSKLSLLFLYRFMILLVFIKLVWFELKIKWIQFKKNTWFLYLLNDSGLRFYFLFFFSVTTIGTSNCMAMMIHHYDSRRPIRKCWQGKLRLASNVSAPCLQLFISLLQFIQLYSDSSYCLAFLILLLQSSVLLNILE